MNEVEVGLSSNGWGREKDKPDVDAEVGLSQCQQRKMSLHSRHERTMPSLLLGMPSTRTV